jgi:hypothetical protein
MRRRLEEAAQGHIEMPRHKAFRGRRVGPGVFIPDGSRTSCASHLAILSSARCAPGGDRLPRRAVDNLLQRVPRWRQHTRFDHRADHARRCLVRRETVELLLGLGRELGAWRLRNDLPEFLFRGGV